MVADTLSRAFDKSTGEQNPEIAIVYQHEKKTKMKAF